MGQASPEQSRPAKTGKKKTKSYSERATTTRVNNFSPPPDSPQLISKRLTCCKDACLRALATSHANLTLDRAAQKSPTFSSVHFVYALAFGTQPSDDEAWLAFRVLLEGRGVEVEALPLPVTFFHTKLRKALLTGTAVCCRAQALISSHNPCFYHLSLA